MEIRPANTIATRRASADAFTGTVWHDPIIDAPAPARVRAARVSFEPGARTARHTHPLGQTLHVLSRVGRVQTWSGPVREISPGDTVWIPQARSTGTGPRLAPAWSISPCRKRWMDPTSLGWSM
jgi:quercetin dioxygenase-like cupin family protein